MTNSEKPRLQVQIREREGKKLSSLLLQADSKCIKGLSAAARSSRGNGNMISYNGLAVVFNYF